MPRPLLGMFTTDLRLVIRTWDACLAEMTGINAAQALDRPLESIVPDLDARGLLSVFRQVAADGVVQVLAPALHKYLIPCAAPSAPTGSAVMPQRMTIGPVREEGRITGVAVTIEDASQPESDGVGSLTRALGDHDWRARQDAVRELAPRGAALVDTIVATLRAQHRDFSVLSSLLDLLATADVDVVEPLIACLADDETDLRIQAALILGQRHDRRAVPALIAALDDPDANVRFHAVEALGTLRATDATERLVDIASSGDFFLAFPAIHALARLGDPGVAPRLVPLLQNDLLRAAVAETLGALGDELVVVPLVELLNRPDAPTEVVADALAGVYERYEDWYGAGEHIASLVRRSIAAVGTQGLVDGVHRVDADRLRGIARVLGWLNGAAVERALTRLLGQRSVRAQVVEALVRYGAGVVDLLIDQLGAEDLETRQAAAVALGRIGDRKATAALVAALGDPELALESAGALAHLGDRAAFEPLLDLLGHQDVAVRQAAIAALNSIGHPDMPERIVPLLDDANPIVRESAVKIAGYFGYAECIEAVLDRCSDPVESVRRAAVEHLPLFDDDRVAGVLVCALERDTPPVRAVAATALGSLADGRVSTALLAALRDEDSWVRYFALRSLGASRDASVAPAVLDVIDHDPAGHVRLAAIEVLGRLDANGARATLEPLTQAAEPDIARAAIRALAQAGDDSATAIVERLLRADEPWRRVEAVTALGLRGGRGVASTLQWVAAADADRDVVRAAIAALVALGTRETADAVAATSALVALCAEPSCREACVAALAGFPSRRIADVAKGLQHPSAPVRCAAIEALSRMKRPDASRALERALDDPMPEVRATAINELRRLGSRAAAKKLLTLARSDPDRDVRQAAILAAAQQRADVVADSMPEER